MGKFSVTVDSTADVAATVHQVWIRLVDPKTLVRLTPLLTGIDADGDTWVWHMARVGVLSIKLTPSFTEHMSFTEDKLITFSHQPPKGTRERIGAEGRYELSSTDSGAHLNISLTITADLPLPSSAGSAVERVMRATTTRMGDRFSDNLLADLAADPDVAKSG